MIKKVFGRCTVHGVLIAVASTVLSVVAAVGAALSYAGQYTAARRVFGTTLGAGFPLLTDSLILGASVMHVANVRQGQRSTGWRLTAHAAIAGTIALNALAAPTRAAIPWHVTAPIVWSVLVELIARQALRRYRAARAIPADRIPARLWLTDPGGSWRLWLWMGRTGERSVARARIDLAVHRAALEALKLGVRQAGARDHLAGQLRAGALAPGQVPGILGWHVDTGEATGGDEAFRRALQTILAPPPAPIAHRRPTLDPERPAQRRRTAPRRSAGPGAPSGVTTLPSGARRRTGPIVGLTDDPAVVGQLVAEMQTLGPLWRPDYARRVAGSTDGASRRTWERRVALARRVLAGEAVLEAEYILDAAEPVAGPVT